MPRLVALLRAVNLGPRNRLAMADWRADLEAAGFRGVRTHVVSGNAVFTAPGTAAAAQRKVAPLVAKRVGRDIAVFVRTAAGLERIVALDPFRGSKVAPNRQVVTFLDRPAKGVPLGPDPRRRIEVLRVEGREVYSVAVGPPGSGGTPNEHVERTLGVRATSRNWNVVRALAAMAAAPVP